MCGLGVGLRLYPSSDMVTVSANAAGIWSSLFEYALFLRILRLIYIREIQIAVSFLRRTIEMFQAYI